MITFRYKFELSHKNEIVKRPVADVEIKTRGGLWIHFYPYIDSGADVTLLPLSFGKLVGFNRKDKEVEALGGIRGTIPVIYFTNPIKIGTVTFPIRLAWSLIENVPPLLGRADIFDRFTVTFKQKEGTIAFE